MRLTSHPPTSRKERNPEVHFYEWSITRWLSSAAHDELDALGRGIYREMLDTCYAQGSVPSDPEILCRKCACTPAELEARWETIRRHFRQHKKSKNLLTNALADVMRKQFFKFRTEQRRNGARRWDKKEPEKSNGINDSDRLASSEPKNNFRLALAILEEDKNKIRIKEEKRSNGSLAPDDLASALCGRHRKTGDRTLVEHALADVLSSLPETDPGDLCDFLDRRHVAWCRYWEGNCEQVKFWPKLSDWLTNGGWRDLPPDADTGPDAPAEWQPPVWMKQCHSCGHAPCTCTEVAHG